MPSESSPSWHDFAAIDLPAAVEKIANNWESLAPLIPGRPDYRVLIDVGRVAAYSIEAQMIPGDIIELLGITVDIAPPWLTDLDQPGEDAP